METDEVVGTLALTCWLIQSRILQNFIGEILCRRSKVVRQDANFLIFNNSQEKILQLRCTKGFYYGDAGMVAGGITFQLLAFQNFINVEFNGVGKFDW